MDQWAEFVRTWLLGQDWLVFLHAPTVRAPDWILALGVPLGVLITFAIIVKGLGEAIKATVSCAQKFHGLSRTALDWCMAKRLQDEYDRGFADGRENALSQTAMQHTHELAMIGKLTYTEMSAYKKLILSSLEGFDLDDGTNSD